MGRDTHARCTYVHVCRGGLARALEFLARILAKSVSMKPVENAGLHLAPYAYVTQLCTHH